VSNAPPNASFLYSCSDLTCDFTDSSTDSDGSVVSWDWDFGDGSTSSVQSPTHTYAAAGTRLVTITVTDDLGATDVTSQSVTVAAGTQLTVMVSGTNFAAGAQADFGERIAVRSVTFQSSTLLQVVIRVHRHAAPGPRAVTVTNPDGLSGSSLSCFAVN
jgi:PKD repeat protein